MKTHKRFRFQGGYYVLLLTTFLISLFYSSCSDDFNEFVSDENTFVESRASGDSLTTAEIEWLDTFRLNLKDGTLNLSYSLEDAIYGMEAFFNLIPGHGFKQINSVNERSRTKTYTIANETISRSELRDMFDDIHASVDSFYDDLSISNKSFLFLDLNIENETSTTMDVEFTSYIADAEEVTNPVAYDLESCTGGFDSGDCFVSA